MNSLMMNSASHCLFEKNALLEKTGLLKNPSLIKRLLFFFFAGLPVFSHADSLTVTLEMKKAALMPPVMIVYWPEDSSLSEPAIMDHKDGHFTRKLIVGKKGSEMLLRNNDDVGHTIYVKDIKQNVKWQLNYMPPKSEFKQTLFWEEDRFVEMRCRLHHYMSAWVGSIGSRHYAIVEPEPEKSLALLKMSGFPAGFSKIKIWMPKYPLIEVSLAQGAKTVPLEKNGKARGTISLVRMN